MPVPTRTSVEPSSTAISKSPVIPIDSSGRALAPPSRSRSSRRRAKDERTALSLGINADWMATLSASFGAGLAAIAAIIIIPLGTITVNEGYHVLINALAVCIIGGLGSTGGVVMASFVIGFAQRFTDSYVGSHWIMIVSLVALLIVLIIKPSGLYGKQKELEERVAEVVSKMAGLRGESTETIERWAMGKLMPELIGRVDPTRVKERISEVIREREAKRES